MFPIPLRRESRVTGYGLAGNRKSYTYWLANAFVFFVRDNLVNTPKICTSTSQFFPCSIYVSQNFSASRRHSRPAMTRNPDPPYSPSTPLLGCLGGCSTFTRTWPGHVLVCALFVIMYLTNPTSHQPPCSAASAVAAPSHTHGFTLP